MICLVLVMCAMTVYALYSATEFMSFAEDGYMVPSSPNVNNLLSVASAERVGLEKINKDDVLYTSLLNYYIRDGRKEVDMSYPIYTNGGATIKFTGDENWLISNDINLLSSYEGLYLTGGNTFNEDLSLADGDEFILLTLDNGLHINAQEAVFKGPLGDLFIPANSIIKFDHSYIRFYSFDNEVLVYNEQDAVFDAEIMIGDNTYIYKDLVTALGIVDTMIRETERGGDTEELEEKIENLLNTDGIRPNNVADYAAGGVSDELGEPADDDTEGETSQGEDTDDTDGDDDDELSEKDDEDEDENADDEDESSDDNDEQDEDDTNDDTGEEDEDNEGGSGDDNTGDGDDDADKEDDDTDGSGSGSDEQGDADSSGGDASGGGSGDTSSGEGEGEGEGEDEGTGGADEGESDGGESDPDLNPPPPDPGNPDDTGGESDEDQVDTPYSDPIVKVDGFDTWLYALKADVGIVDPSGALIKGVSITVYQAIDNYNATASTVVGANGESINVYSKNDVKGLRTRMRKTFYGTQEAILSPLYPDTTYYLQYNYSYDEIIYDANNVGTATRINVVSDIYEIKTQSVAEAKAYLPTIVIEYDQSFAEEPNALTFDNFTLSNGSVDGKTYDPTDESFANHKLNLLPYITSMRVELDNQSPLGSEEDVYINASDLIAAHTNVAGISYKSNDVLESDSHYTFKFIPSDRYDTSGFVYTVNGANAGAVNGVDGSFYTSKAPPIATVEIVENANEYVILEITVEDKDDALLSDPLKLSAFNSVGAIAYLDGTFVDAQNDDIADKKFTGAQTIVLGTEGKYRIKVTNLPFAELHNFYVTASYNLQPTGVSDPMLSDVNDEVIGIGYVSTVSLSSGLINYDVIIKDVMDKSTTLEFYMNEYTTPSILPIIDRYDITLTNEGNEQIFKYSLKKNDLEDAIVGVTENYVYNTYTNSVILKSAGDDDITIELVGEQDKFVGEDLWDVFQSYATPTPEDPGLRHIPVTIRVSFNSGLIPATEYTVNVQTVVERSGREYNIRTVLGKSEFKTKKETPEVTMDDLIIANDIINFSGLEVVDNHGVILDDGKFVIHLYNNGALLYILDKDENGQPLTTNTNYESIGFSGLTPGLEYQLEIVANEYNNDDGYSGYARDVILFASDIIAGSDITGTVQLTHLDYEDKSGPSKTVTITPDASIDDPFRSTSINQGLDEWWHSTNTLNYYTPAFDISTTFGNDAKYVVLENYAPSSSSGDVTESNTVYYFDGSGNIVSLRQPYYGSSHGLSTSLVVETRARDPIAIPLSDEIVGNDVESFRFKVNNVAHIKENGLIFSVYNHVDKLFTVDIDEADRSKYTLDNESILPGDAEDYLHANSALDDTSGEVVSSTAGNFVMHKLPVTEGDRYTTNAHLEWVTYYNEEGGLISKINDLGYNSTFIIPQNVAYMSIEYLSGSRDSLTINRLSQGHTVEADPEKYEFEAKLDINIVDKKGSLVDAQGDGEVTVRIYKSDNINSANYKQIDTVDYEIIKGEISETVTDETGQQSELIHSVYTLNADGSPMELTLSNLEHSTAYMVRLYGSFGGTEMIFGEEIFQTDAPYKIISNEQEFFDISRDMQGNYLVVNDLNIGSGTIDGYFEGTIDFNGHTVTVGGRGGNDVFDLVSTNAVMKNLNLVFSEEYEDHNDLRFVGSNYGLIENIVVEFLGDINMVGYNVGLFAQTNYGTIRNFIVRFEGDVYCTATYGSLFVSNTAYGMLENGYIYMKNGAGLFVDPDATDYFGGIVRHIGYGGGVNNVYTIYDSWMANSGTVYAQSGINYSGTVSNTYHVGDVYIHDGNSKSRTTPLSVTKLTHSYPITDINRWNVTQVDHSIYNSYDAISIIGYEALRDTVWQSDVLQKEFEIEQSVARGFYPRLELPVIMQKHQEYVRMPLTTSNDFPVIVADRFADDVVGNQTKSAKVVFDIENAGGYEVTNLKINNIDVVEGSVEMEAINENGHEYYRVSATLEIDEENTSHSYKSNYKVTEIEAMKNGVTYDFDSEYETQQIEFYKEIDSVADWSAIDEVLAQRYWNFWVTKDLDFSAVQKAEDIIVNFNSDATTYNSYSHYYGKLDGGIYDDEGNLTGMRELQDINFKDVSTAHIFTSLHYTASSSTTNIYRGTISNLIINGFDVTTNLLQKISWVGVVGRSGGDIINVHLKNAVITADGTMGGIVGELNNGSVQDCSVTDSVFKASTGRYTSYFGGIVGRSGNDHNRIQHSYTRNVHIDMTNAKTVSAVGGIVGSFSGEVVNSYANGSIIAAGNNIGGIVGHEYYAPSIISCFSDVDITGSAGNVGGLVGKSDNLLPQTMNNLVVGDILVQGGNIHRLIGQKGGYQTYYTRFGYAYKEQVMNDLSEDDIDGATDLFTTAELSQVATWTDTMLFGVGYEYYNKDGYSNINEGYFPFIYNYYGTGLVYGQEQIALPEVSGLVVSPEFGDVKIDGLNTSYYAEFTLWHEELSQTALKEYFIDSGPTDTTKIEVVIDGMNMHDTSFDNDPNFGVKLTANQPTDGKSIRFSVTTHIYDDAFDSYKLNVKLSDTGATAETMFNYGEPLYHTINNTGEWIDKIENDDWGTTNQNIKIGGIIDFDSPAYESIRAKVGLKFGRLEGDGNDPTQFGFANLTFATTEDNPDSFISNVLYDVKYLGFTNMDMTFSSHTVWKTHACIIDKIGGSLEYINLKDIYMAGKMGAITGSIAPFGDIGGHARYINVHSDNWDGVDALAPRGDLVGYNDELVKGTGVYITTTDGTTGNGSSTYAAGVMGSVVGTVSDIQADDIIVNVPYSYSSSIIGHETTNGLNDIEKNVENITVTNSKSIGEHFSSAFMRTINYANNTQNIIMDNVFVDATYNGYTSTSQSGGIASNTSNSTYINNIDMTNSEIVSGRIAGGITCNVSGVSTVFSDILLKNTNVTSGVAGGVVYSSDERFRDVTIIGCKISTETSEYLQSSGQHNFPFRAGALAGSNDRPYLSAVENVVIRDTEISGPGLIGGLFGYAVDNTELSATNVYIAEDVLIHNKKYRSNPSNYNSSAGGLAGAAYNYTLVDVYMGAQVISEEGRAGGVFGYLQTPVTDTTFESYMSGVYVAGDIVSTDYAGGIIGRVMSGARPIDTQTIDAIFAGSVTSESDRASVWMNHNESSSVRLNSESNFAVWNGALINGQAISDLLTSGTGSVKVPFNANAGGVYEFLADSQKFREREFYTAHGFTDKHLATNLTDEGNIYTPFILNKQSLTILEQSNSYDYPDDAPGAVDVGILLPPSSDVNLDGITIYTSGVDTLNVEAGKDNAITQITIGGTTTNLSYTTYGDYKVATVKYDFKSEVKLGEVTYTADHFAREVMTFGQTWYIINADDKLQSETETYTKLTELKDVTGLPDGAKAVHLWQGKVLTDGGQVYQLNEDAGTETSNVTTSAGEDTTTPVPLFEYSDTQQVFHNFTVYNGAQPNYRAHNIGTKTYLVSPYQGFAYDSFILSYDNFENLTYYANLNSEGTISNYGATLQSEGFPNRNIKYLSNGFGYDDNGMITIAKYNDGTVRVLNFDNGRVLYESIPSDSTFSTFAMNVLGDMYHGIADNGMIEAEQTFVQGELLLNVANLAYDDGLFADGVGVGVDGEKTYTDSDLVDGQGDGSNPLAESNEDRDNAENIDGEASEEEGSGSNSGEGSGSGSGEGGSGSGSNGDDANDTNGTDDNDAASGNGNGNDTDNSEGGDQTEDDETDDAQTSTADLPREATYIKNEGLVVDDKTVVEASQLEYVDDVGLFVDGELRYRPVDQTSQTALLDGAPIEIELISDEMPTGAQGTANGDAITAGAHSNEMGQFALGFNEYTGEFELYETSELYGDGTAPAGKNQEVNEVLAENNIDPQSEFRVNTGNTLTMTNDEENGFRILIIAGCLTLIILFAIYRKLRATKD